MNQYPEHAKLAAVKDLSQEIGMFLDFGGYTLCEADGSHYYPVQKSINSILAKWFDIDEKKLEEEKRAMLDALQTTL